MVLNSRPTRRSHRAWLPVIVIASLLAVSLAEAGRRSIRIDFGAWGPARPIDLWTNTSTCPWASGVSGNPGVYLYAFVYRDSVVFQTATFYEPDSFTEGYCQLSRPYQAGLSTDEYLNEAAFPEEERDLAYMIGPNTNNAVSAVRFSFLGQDNQDLFGRQWAFYFFPNDLLVVGLYGVPNDGSTYPFESIFDQNTFAYVWESVRDGFDGQYFCFQGQEYIGDCVPPAPPPPPPPVEVFMDGFE